MGPAGSKFSCAKKNREVLTNSRDYLFALETVGTRIFDFFEELFPQ
jgi:hypothetical protein